MSNNKRQSAIRTLESLGYEHHGGEYWVPPIGPSAKPVLEINEKMSRANTLLTLKNEELAKELALLLDDIHVLNDMIGVQAI